jgi:replicative DNA helicase
MGLFTSGVGRSAFGLGMATHIAKHSAKPVLVFSLGMGHSELTQRILSSEAKVDSTKLRTGKVSPGLDPGHLTDAAKRVGSAHWGVATGSAGCGVDGGRASNGGHTTDRL